VSILRLIRIVVALWAGARADLVAVAIAEHGSGDDPASSSGSEPSPSKAPPSPEKRTEPASAVTFKEGSLSIRVEYRSLDWVLEEVSREAKVAIIRDGGAARRRVQIRFQDLPLDEGLRRILKDQDYFFFYGAEGNAPASLTAVWVYPKGEGRGLRPVPPETWASTRDLEGDLADADPAVRARAVEALVERKREGAREALLEALKDQDEQVRTRALYKAADEDLELPTATLIELALGDSSPDVRFLALEALADRPEVRTIAEAALNDQSPHVRQRAREILQSLDEATRPRRLDQPARGRSSQTDGKLSDEARR
jgi:hypothetical protein